MLKAIDTVATVASYLFNGSVSGCESDPIPMEPTSRGGPTRSKKRGSNLADAALTPLAKRLQQERQEPFAFLKQVCVIAEQHFK